MYCGLYHKLANTVRMINIGICCEMGFFYVLKMHQDTDNDRCARLAKINASNFTSRL